MYFPLLWHHNGCDDISNHKPHDCLLNRSFRHRSKKTSKPHVTGLCAGNSPVTGEFLAQMASNVENVSIWWCHHAMAQYHTMLDHNQKQKINIFSNFPSPSQIYSHTLWNRKRNSKQKLWYCDILPHFEDSFQGKLDSVNLRESIWIVDWWCLESKTWSGMKLLQLVYCKT